MHRISATKSASRAPLVVAIILLAAASAHAQRPIRHELIRGDMPPGVAADYSRMSNPTLQHHVQPVRIIGPQGSQLEIASNGQFIATDASKVSVGMRVGPVYRFKVSNIPQHAGKELYPSLEILNRLYPPQGLENEFPIQVVISQDDLRQAIDGNLVTKVIYLENPDNALTHRHLQDEQPFFDVGGSEDPLRASEKLGRPMAILRIGSRVPMPSDALEQFDFRAPAPQLLPDPQPVEATKRVSALTPLLTPNRDSASTPFGNVAPIPIRQR